MEEFAPHLEIGDLGDDDPLRFSTILEQSVDPPGDWAVLTLPGVAQTTHETRIQYPRQSKFSRNRTG